MKTRFDISASVLFLVVAAAVTPVQLMAASYKIGLNFGADEYPNSPNAGTLAPGAVAGVPEVAQANWNNLTLATGSAATGINADRDGQAVATTLFVSWTSANTWASTGRNAGINGFATNSADRTLMTGYLDTANATTTAVSLGPLPPELLTGYDLYVYGLGDTANRGGAYRVVDQFTLEVIKDYLLFETTTGNSNYVRELGVDRAAAGRGNYMIFRGLTNEYITLEATTEGGLGFSGTPRAPINAVQLVAAARDTAAPAAPTSLRLDAIGARFMDLSWNGSTDNGPVVIYEIERNGAIAGRSTATTFRDAGLLPGTDYEYRVRAVDDTGNASAFSGAVPDTTATEVEVAGATRRENYLNIPGNLVIDLSFATNYPNNPDSVLYRTVLEGPNNFNNNFGSRYRGWITPLRSGSYVFYLNTDDDGEFYLSTDATPERKRLIATDPTANANRAWVTTTTRDATNPSNRSDKFLMTQWPTGNTINLVAGTKYYYEIIHKDGGGNDFVGVTWRLTTDPEIVNNDASIIGPELSALVDVVGAGVTITNEPVDAAVAEGRTASFTVAASFTSPYVTGVTYQWLRNGVPIRNANAATYTTPGVSIAADHGATYRCFVAVPGASAYSRVATLTVSDPDTTPPTLTSVKSAVPTRISVSFSEPLEAATAETASNYTLSGGASVTSAVLGADLTSVTLTTSALTGGQEYSLTVNNVRDRFGANPIAAGSMKAFTPHQYSIGFNFGADEPSGAFTATVPPENPLTLEPTLAGVPTVAIRYWNNLDLLSGTNMNIAADVFGVSNATSVTISWTSQNTWSSTGRGEENNGFAADTADRALMTGYLDTGAPSTSVVTISDLPAQLTSEGYDVYVYASGGVSARGGGYRVLDAAGGVLKDYVLAQTPANAPNYVQVPVPPPTGTHGTGNYILFTGLRAPAIVVEATTANGLGFGGTQRAAMNAIQLVAPSSDTGGGEPPTLAIEIGGTGITITYTGTLESADNVIGPWTVVAGASPFPVTPTEARKFYRAVNE